ncbi:hypothetical protein BHM03_00010961 [Ensete ventricosum]|nr:hypothetical protein BHM03_00010961 [Ensete ventricosum]
MENDMLFLLLCLLLLHSPSSPVQSSLLCVSVSVLFIPQKKQLSDAHYRMQNTVLLSPFSFFLPIVCFFSGGGGEEWRGSLTGMESYSVKKSKSGCSELSSSLDIILPLFVSLPLWPQIDCPRRTLIKLGGEERSILMQLRSLKPCIIGSNLTHPFAAAVPDYH